MRGRTSVKLNKHSAHPPNLCFSQPSTHRTDSRMRWAADLKRLSKFLTCSAFENLFVNGRNFHILETFFWINIVFVMLLLKMEERSKSRQNFQCLFFLTSGKIRKIGFVSASASESSVETDDPPHSPPLSRFNHFFEIKYYFLLILFSLVKQKIDLKKIRVCKWGDENNIQLFLGFFFVSARDATQHD